MNFRILLVAVAVGFTFSGYAHPGHDLMAHGPAHVATSAYHLWILAATATAALGIAQVVRHRNVRRVLRGAGVAMLLVAAAMWGLGI